MEISFVVLAFAAGVFFGDRVRAYLVAKEAQLASSVKTAVEKKL